MRIIPDEKGRYIVDFEGLEIDCSAIPANKRLGDIVPCNKLFNDNLVSQVTNGKFFFAKKE